MKRVIGAVGLAAAAVALTGCGNFKATTQHEDRSYEVTGELNKLDVSLDSANLEIVGAEVAKVSVHERLSYSKKNKPTTEHRTENGTLVLRHKCPGGFRIGFSECNVGYKIQVPRNFAVQVKNDSGQVRIRAVEGEINASADSGSIKATQLNGNRVTARVDSGNIELEGAGNIQASVDSGSIRGTDLRADTVDARADSGNVELRWAKKPPTSVTANADSGSVRLWLPAGTPYAIDAREDSGQPEFNGINQNSTSPNKIKVWVDSGRVEFFPV